MFDWPGPILIGMVHLPPLPGSARSELSVDRIVARALDDARKLADAGFGALLVENFGDAPFAAGEVEPVTAATMSVVAASIARAVALPIGVNVLRNDARTALGVAVASGARFVRVNVHVGVAATDQGVIQGQARRTLQLRNRVAPGVSILADVHVKHSTPMNQPDIARAAEETAYRGLADALVVSGPATGQPTDPADLQRVRHAVPDRPILIGSGVTAETVAGLLALADGAIVGTSVKHDGRPENPVDPERARCLVEAAGVRASKSKGHA